MSAKQERDLIRVLHLVLSVPIIGYLYSPVGGPIGLIPQAAWFIRWIAVPVVVLSGLWLWLKPKFVRLVARLSEGGKLSSSRS
jgi:D-alanyl-lipoteichoic acid acyltransferase DltB (MBOAT superfamily)